MRRGDLLGLAAVALTFALLFAFRRQVVEPREWVGYCVSADPPLACVPRAALLWLQTHQLWGLAALTAGLAALISASLPVAVAAICLGIAAVLNYNATWGMLGAALGAWGWIVRSRRLRGREPG